MFLGQAMIGAQNKSLGVTDDDVQIVEKDGIRIVRSMLAGVAFQRGDVAAITVTVYYAAISKGSVGKFPHGYESCGAPSPLLPKPGDGTWHIDTVRWPAGMRGGSRISSRHTLISTASLPDIPGTVPR